MSNRKGVILITLMWVIVILSLLAWGISRRSSIGISMVESYRARVIAQANATSAVSQIMDWIRLYPVDKDTLYQTALDRNKAQAVTVDLSNVLADVNHPVTALRSNEGYGLAEKKEVEGIIDLGGRININVINDPQILTQLFILKGISSAQADDLAKGIIDFRVYGQVTTAIRGKTRLKHKMKPFEHLEELFDVNGMTREIFAKIKDDITVYGTVNQGRLAINPCTASNDVITAAIRYEVQAQGGSDPEVLARQVIAMRDGPDRMAFTKDDCTEAMPFPSMTLNTVPSGSYAIRVKAVDSTSGVKVEQIAIVRMELSGGTIRLLSWEKR